MRSLDHARLLPFISAPRLSTYRKFFRPQDDVELVGCYLWNKEVTAAFFPLLQILEVTLRNAIHSQARQAYGSYWFDNVPCRPKSQLSHAQNRHVKNLSKWINESRQSIRRECNIPQSKAVPEDKIIANLTFGFWTNLFSAAFHVNRNPKALWPNLLRAVFPNAPKGFRSRDLVQSKLLKIKNFRNRSFHHEPIWNIGYPHSETDAMIGLVAMKDEIVTVIRWMSKESEDLVYKSGLSSEIDRVCSIQCLHYFQSPGMSDISATRARRELRKLMRIRKKTIDITVNGQKISSLINS